MGLHTWFYADKKLYDERKEFYEKIDKYYSEILEDEYENHNQREIFEQEYARIHELDVLNDLHDFHDEFRTNKREENGEYTLDIIYSEEECKKWLLDNKDEVYNLRQERIDIFWKKYPNGVIDFG